MTTPSAKPNLWNRFVAFTRGEISAGVVESYRRAGAPVYTALDELESRRLSEKIEGKTPWTASREDRVVGACTWNAFALQTLGDALLQADYETSPATVGYVPPVTREQALAFFTQVEGWLAHANRFRFDAKAELDVELPADLPVWVEVDPCPKAHVVAMLAAAKALRTHAESAWGAFDPGKDATDEQRASIRRVEGILAEANGKLEFATSLWAPDVARSVHEDVEQHAKVAIERYYHLGQLLAWPDLLAHYPRAPIGRGAAGGGALPGSAAFDPWVLTDPRSRATWRADAKAREAMDHLWKSDPDPRRTLVVQAQIEAALAHGDIAHATDSSGEPLGHYYCCPWAAIYVARRPVVIGGRRLSAMEQFVFDVSAEEMEEGGAFKREILVSTFSPTSEVDYCVD